MLSATLLFARCCFIWRDLCSMAPRSTVTPTHGQSQHVQHSHVTVTRTFNLAIMGGFRSEIRDRRCSQLCDRFSRNRTNEEIALIVSRIAAHNGRYGAHLRYGTEAGRCILRAMWRSCPLNYDEICMPRQCHIQCSPIILHYSEWLGYCTESD